MERAGLFPYFFVRTERESIFFSIRKVWNWTAWQMLFSIPFFFSDLIIVLRVLLTYPNYDSKLSIFFQRRKI